MEISASSANPLPYISFWLVYIQEAARRPKRRYIVWPKGPPRRLLMPPRRPKRPPRNHKSLPGSPRKPQEAPRGPREAPRLAQEAQAIAKRPPRGLQGGPRGFQGGAGGIQDGPISLQGCLGGLHKASKKSPRSHKRPPSDPRRRQERPPRSPRAPLNHARCVSETNETPCGQKHTKQRPMSTVIDWRLPHVSMFVRSVLRFPNSGRF